MRKVRVLLVADEKLLAAEYAYFPVDLPTISPEDCAYGTNVLNLQQES